jgi:hypothetical protein
MMPFRAGWNSERADCEDNEAAQPIHGNDSGTLRGVVVQLSGILAT